MALLLTTISEEPELFIFILHVTNHILTTPSGLHCSYSSLSLMFFYMSAIVLEWSKLLPRFECVSRRDHTHSCDVSGPSSTPATVPPTETIAVLLQSQRILPHVIHPPNRWQPYNSSTKTSPALTLPLFIDIPTSRKRPICIPAHPMHVQSAGGTPYWNATGATVVLLSLPRRKLIVVSTTKIQSERPRKKAQEKSECDGSEAHHDRHHHHPQHYNTGPGCAVRPNAPQAQPLPHPPRPPHAFCSLGMVRSCTSWRKRSCVRTGCPSSRTGPLTVRSGAGVERCAAAATVCLCCVKWDVRAAKARNLQLFAAIEAICCMWTTAWPSARYAVCTVPVAHAPQSKSYCIRFACSSPR